jgi:hypothetical protein
MPQKNTSTPPAAEKPKRGRRAPRSKAEAKARELFVVTTPASFSGAELRIGQIAEEGAKILKTHAHLFKPVEVTYKA